MGVKTLYEYFYKLAYGDKGADKATLVNDCLDVADAQIKANKDGLAGKISKTGDFTAGKITKINNASGIIEEGTNTDTDVADAVTKKHAKNTDTDLDATFEALFAKKTDKLSVFAPTTSAELAGVISDEVGSGKLVFATEGEWTIGVSFGGGTTGITYSTNTGYYTKIGNIVTISGRLALTSKGTDTGNVLITGLPFTVVNNDAGMAPVALFFYNITFANQLEGFAQINTTVISLHEVTEAGTLTTLTNADFVNTSLIAVNCTYRCQ